MSGPETDVRVDVRARVVAVGVEQPSVATIVPVAPRVEANEYELFPLLSGPLIIDGLNPSA